MLALRPLSRACWFSCLLALGWGMAATLPTLRAEPPPVVPPAAPSAAPDAPPAAAEGSLVPDTQILDYGIVEQNREYTRHVVLRNAGTLPIQGLQLRTDCGCYTASLTARDLTPGASATLTVTFRTLTFSGPVRKSLVLTYKDDADRTLRLGLHLEISAGVVSHPGRLHLGDVRVGERPEGLVRVGWYDGVGQPFQLRAVEVGAAPLDARWGPWQGTEDPRWRGFEIRLAFREPPPKGPYFTEVVVLTSDAARPRIVIPVTANVSGLIYVPRPRVYLGLLREGSTQVVDVPFRPQDPNASLGEIRVRVVGSRVQATLLPTQGARGERQIRITLTGKEAPGRLDDVVELRCTAAPSEVAEIEVRGRVFAAPAGEGPPER